MRICCIRDMRMVINVATSVRVSEETLIDLKDAKGYLRKETMDETIKSLIRFHNGDKGTK